MVRASDFKREWETFMVQFPPIDLVQEEIMRGAYYTGCLDLIKLLFDDRMLSASMVNKLLSVIEELDGPSKGN